MKFFIAGLVGLLTACAFQSSSPTDALESDVQVMVSVFKSDGSRQCGDVGFTPQSMLRELSAHNIAVSCIKKSRTGYMYPSVCGADTGRINVFTIGQSDLGHAMSLGFKPVSELPDFKDEVCTDIP